MIEIKIDAQGKNTVKMQGNDIVKLFSEVFYAIEAVYTAFNEYNHEHAEAFKDAFYKAAKDKKFFNWEKDERTREQKLMDEYMENGLFEDTARGLVDLAKQVVDALGKAAEEVRDENHD